MSEFHKIAFRVYTYQRNPAYDILDCVIKQCTDCQQFLYIRQKEFDKLQNDPGYKKFELLCTECSFKRGT